jgi:hypothetical protein
MHRAFVSAFVCGFSVLAADLPAVDELPDRPELPDPFVMLDGTRIETPEQWYEQRRPELKQLFQHYVYGNLPPPTPIQAKVIQEDRDLFEGKAVLRQIEISFPALPDNAPRIHLALFVPNDGEPSPCFLVVNKCGNCTVTDYPGVIVSHDAWRHTNCPSAETQRGSQKDFWAVEDKIARGYAFATFHESDIDPDRDDFTDGIHPFFPDLPGPEEAKWGTISAWAWGLQRCLDYLIEDPDVDGDKVIVTGHSRRGKTALWAAAYDDRFAIAMPHQSGTGGMALSRNNDQETVERINTHFPHWFNDVFWQFNGNESKLPVDQHLLVALVAPRPLLDTAGLQDTWANYESALRNLKAADTVYEFLGTPGLVGDGMVVEDEPIAGDDFGTLLQYRRDTKHTWNVDYWNKMMDFADLHFKRR